MKSSTLVRGIITLTVCALTLTALASAGPTSGVAPVRSKPHGKSYVEWAEAMLQWVAALPADVNPFIDTTGELTQAAESGKVWFLMGPSQLLDQPQTSAITMPVGTSIFFSPLAVYCAGPGYLGGGDDTPEELEYQAKMLAPAIEVVKVEIDGVLVKDIEQYRILTPIVPLNTPDDNIYYEYFSNYEDPFTFGIFGGFGLFLEPFSPGVHVIHAVSGVPDFGLYFDITYTITVRPGK